MEDSQSPTSTPVPSSSISPTQKKTHDDEPIKIKSETENAGKLDCQQDKGWGLAEGVVKSESKSYETTQREADSTHSGDSSGTPGKDDPRCAVCGDKANGMHYRALTCEGCKTFFRRNARRRDSLKCDMDDEGKCEMDLYMRRHCAYCRMKKCLDVGMQVGRLWDKDRLKTRKPIKKTKSTSSQDSTEGDNLETSPGPPSTPPAAASKLELSKEQVQLMSLIHLAYQNSIERNQEVPDRPTETMQEARSHPTKEEAKEDDITQAIVEGMSSVTEGMSSVTEGMSSVTEGMSSVTESMDLPQGSIDSLTAGAAVGTSAECNVPMETKMADDIPSCSTIQYTDYVDAEAKLKAGLQAPPGLPSDSGGMFAAMEKMMCGGDAEAMGKMMSGGGAIPGGSGGMFAAMGQMMSGGGGAMAAAMGPMMMMMGGGAPGHQGASSSSDGEGEFKEPVHKHIMEVVLLILRQMIMFAKALPGFLSLQCEDQAALVKGTFVEYLVLTSGGIFDVQQKQFMSLVLPGESYGKKDAKMAGFEGMIGQVIEFSEKMARLELTKEEKSLLYAICVLTADRPELSDDAKDVICTYQEPIVDALCASGRVLHPDQPQFFPKCVMLLTELRNCTESFMENIMQLKLKGNVIQPLLKEVFEI